MVKCFEDGESFMASRKTLIKVLAVVSRTFNSEISTRARTEAEKNHPQTFYQQNLANYCCENGYASLLKYAIDNKTAIGVEIRIRGHLDCLKVLVDHGCELNYDRMEEAAWGGHVNIVKYLIEKGLQPTSKTMKHAVESGNIELVKFLQQRMQTKKL